MVSKDKPEDLTPPATPPPKAAPAPGKGGAANAKSRGGQKPARRKPDPTRYGDWQKNGRCIDF